MIIENLESLKSWLIQTLTPICDADPDTLAKYVIALVKKDKPLDELRESCFRDLDVFLQDKTKAFVSCLFDALQSKSYSADSDVKIGDNNQKDLEGSVVSKEGVRPGSRSGDDALKRTYVSSSDRENISQELSRTDGRLLEERVGRKEHYGVNDEDYRPSNSYRRPIDTRKGLLPYQSCSSETELNRAAYGAGARPGGESAPHHVPNPYEPFLMKQAQSGYRPRTSSLHRRDVDSSRRDHQQPASRNSVRDYHRLNDKPRHYPSLNKVYGSETSGRYGSPARSLESDRIDGRRALGHPWPQRNPDVRKNQSPRPIRSPMFDDRSRTRSRTASRTPSRSVDPVPALRSSRSRSPSRLKSQSPSLSRRSSRSRSPTGNDASSRHASAGEELVNSRSSTPLEEEKYKVSELQLKMQYDARPAPRPRCRDYDEKGFCIRGDLCDFDHGNDPVIVDSIKIPFPSGRLSDPATGTLPPAPLPPPLCPPLLAPMPYISRVVTQAQYEDSQKLIAPPMPFPRPEGGTQYLAPPPHLMPPVPHLRGIDLHLYPPPGPPHMCPFPMMPQSFVGNRPLTLQFEPTRAVRDLYQPVVLPADPYLPEPYSPKSPTYQSMSKSSDSREANVAIDTAGFSAQKFGSSQISVSRHSNLVRVPTEESQKLVEEKSDASIRPGTKRSADVLDTSSGSAASTAQPPPLKKTTFEHPGVHLDVQNFSGVRHGGVNNTTLELRKIPREQNTIANINDHFSKFGIIVNLQVGWDGDQQAALVSFASNAQAQLAYRSQEPFLNNRFIKIFWHNAEKPSQPQALPVSAADTSRQRIIIPERHKLQLNNRLKNAMQAAKTITTTVQQQQQQPQSTQDAMSSVKVAGINSSAGSQPAAIVTPSTTNDNGTTPVSTSVSAPTAVKSAPEAANKGSTKLQRQSSKEIPNKSVILKQLEVQKKLQELLTKHIDQQKILFVKLEKDKSTLTAEEKANIIETIKLLAKKIEELKTSISSTIEPDLVSKGSVVSKTAMPISAPTGAIPSRGSLRKVNNSVTRSLGHSGKQSFAFGGSPPSTKGPIFQDSKQAQKALLDTELDLINRQKDGSDAAELLKRVAALKEEAASLGLLGPTLNPGSKPGGSLSHVRGHGGAVGRGRGIVQGARRWSGGFAGTGHTIDRPHTVDRRPKQLLITGFLTDEKDDLLSHLQEFGELDDSVFDLSIPSLSVTFKSRLHAEKAAVDGRSFNGKELKMVWQKPASVLTERNSAQNADLLTTEKAEVKMLKEVSADAVDAAKLLVNSLPSDVLQKEDIVKSIVADAVEKPKSDGSILKKARLYSLTGEEEEFDEDTLLSIDEEDEDDNHEGGRPWRR